jgi:hypothetical protein
MPMASERGIFRDVPDHPRVDESLPPRIDLAKLLQSIDLCMDHYWIFCGALAIREPRLILST